MTGGQNVAGFDVDFSWAFQNEWSVFEAANALIGLYADFPCTKVKSIP